jgi:hypothetical protein
MSDLPQKVKETITYLGAQCQGKTVDSRSASWLANVQANREYYRVGNPPLLGMTAYVVGAGPSLRKNVAELKKVGKLGLVICVDAAFRYMMAQGVVPDYCVTLDADSRMLSMVEGADTSKTTLVAQASASPNLVAAWKGPRYFLRATGGSKELDDKLHAAHRVVRAKKTLVAGEILNPIEDVEVEFPGLNDALACGGNVTTYAHSFALSLLRAVRVVFVGCDYSWVSDDDFYAGGEHRVMSEERMDGEKILSHITLGGGECSTNFTLFHLKTWHEELAAAHMGHCVNATEGGILGIDKDGNSKSGWKHITLAEAVASYTPSQAAAAASLEAVAT